jgi:hypothetical protein
MKDINSNDNNIINVWLFPPYFILPTPGQMHHSMMLDERFDHLTF